MKKKVNKVFSGRSSGPSSRASSLRPRRDCGCPPKTCLLLSAIIVAMLAWTGFCFLFSQYFVAFVSMRVLGFTSAQLQEPLNLAIYDLIVYSLMVFLNVGLPYLFFKTHKVPKKYQNLKITRENLGLAGLPTWTDIGLAPVGFIVYFILAAILAGVFTAFFPWFDANQAQNVGFDSLYNGFDRLAAFFALVVVAPIAEEIIFRGWLYGKLRVLIPKKFSLPISILIVSALFGFLHLQWNVGINVFCLSLVLCVLREITGTIHSGILLHMLKNGFAFYLLYVINMV